MDLTELAAAFGRPPQPWSEGRTIPWDDPDFSRRMLAEHLSQANDGASRRATLIDAHVRFIETVALPRGPARLLDLGCGPGLYCLRFAEAGHDCSGIDFAPAAIVYARSRASEQNLSCRFLLGDIRGTAFDGPYDLVMLLYGELNLFPEDEALDLLRRCAEALAPDGRLLLEVHAFAAVRARGLAPPRWSAAQTGLFSDRPHLRLEQSFWLQDTGFAAGRHWIVDSASAEVSLYGWTMKAYTEDGYGALLARAGLSLVQRFENLTGSNEAGDFPVLLAAKPRAHQG